jgi:hypothetical protein
MENDRLDDLQNRVASLEKGLKLVLALVVILAIFFCLAVGAGLFFHYTSAS